MTAGEPKNEPKYVSFYSFKGGHGRSTTLANIANLWSRTGKKVLCLDLDLESPGLAGLYGLPLSTPGFVEYADQLRKGNKPKFSPVERPVQLVNGSMGGSLHVMPAGRFAGDDREASQAYWSFMAQGAQDVFSASPLAD